MGCQYDVDPCFDHIRQPVQEPPELLFCVYIPIAISEIFNPGLVVFITDMLYTELLRPVDCVDHERAAHARCFFYVIDLFKEQRPTRRTWQARYVHRVCAPFRVDEYGIRKMGSKRGLPNPFRTVNDNFLCFLYLSSCNLHLESSLLPCL